jgi:putative DNA primase/helicase
MGDSHKNAEVMRGLQPLADMASTGGFALLGITHFTKQSSAAEPIDRITGSLAFGALARVVLVATKNPDKERNRAFGIFCRAKSNLGQDDGGFAYDLDQTELTDHPGFLASRILWRGALEGSARQLLAVESGSRRENDSALHAAKQFLRHLLLAPLPVASVRSAAEAAGYAWATIRRARRDLDIVSIKDGMAGGWIWCCPDQLSRSPTE